MDDSGTRVAGVLPVAQLATCVLATALGFVYLVDALGDAPPSWLGLALGALGVVATVLVWRSRSKLTRRNWPCVLRTPC